MSDALSDINQDMRIEEDIIRINQIEKDFLINPSQEIAQEIISEWRSHTKMGDGYFLCPGVNPEKIWAYTQFIRGKIDADELRSYCGEETGRPFYFAVEGHGHLMPGNFEPVINEALKRKYGKRIDAFKSVIDDNGRIDLEKISCSECSNLLGNFGCSMKNRCNCYDVEEYSSRKLRVKEGRRILKEYEQ